MFTAFFTGFFLGLSLIMAIGAQNAFVLRVGIMRQHVFFVALFCASSDAILICIGISSISIFFNNLITQYESLLFGISSIWLLGYGLLRMRSVFKSNSEIKIDISVPKGLLPTISILTILTFANPHVYLDTMVLIGSISQQFTGNLKVAFAIGASLASFVFFFSLAYGAMLLLPIMKSHNSWRVLDLFIALIMFTIAIKLAFLGNWF